MRFEIYPRRWRRPILHKTALLESPSATCVGQALAPDERVLVDAAKRGGKDHLAHLVKLIANLADAIGHDNGFDLVAPRKQVGLY